MDLVNYLLKMIKYKDIFDYRIKLKMPFNEYMEFENINKALEYAFMMVKFKNINVKYSFNGRDEMYRKVIIIKCY